MTDVVVTPADCHIELQQARLTAPVTTIEATTLLGPVEVRTPDHWERWKTER